MCLVGFQKFLKVFTTVNFKIFIEALSYKSVAHCHWMQEKCTYHRRLLEDNMCAAHNRLAEIVFLLKKLPLYTLFRQRKVKLCN
jgi:hypothetical protein